MYGDGRRKRKDGRNRYAGESSEEDDDFDDYGEGMKEKKRKIDREEEDPFHLASHPILPNDEGEDDHFALFAHEADLLSNESNSNPNDLIDWNGRTFDQDTIKIKTDRYDILHLLESLPNGGTLIGKNSMSSLQSNSPVVGLSDLESDVEDVFFLSKSEAENVRKEKRRKRLEELRLERIQQREEEDEKIASNNNDSISKDQFNLMMKTSEALRKATNKSALESRILANHGNDVRFRFLSDPNNQSDRVQQVWKCMMEGKQITLEKADEDEENQSNAVLVSYQSSEEEQEDIPVEEDAESKRKRKLALAQEWIRKRRERKSQQEKDQAK